LQADFSPRTSGLARAIARQGRSTTRSPCCFKAIHAGSFPKDLLLELASQYEAIQPEKAIAIYRDFPANPARRNTWTTDAASRPSEDAVPALEAAVANLPRPRIRIALAHAYARAKQLEKATPWPRWPLPPSRDLDCDYFTARLLRDQRKFPKPRQQFFARTQNQPIGGSLERIGGRADRGRSISAGHRCPGPRHSLRRETSAHLYLRPPCRSTIYIKIRSVALLRKVLAEPAGQESRRGVQRAAGAAHFAEETGKR